MNTYVNTVLYVGCAMVLASAPNMSHATASPIQLNCTSANFDEVMPVATLLKKTIPSDIYNDPIAMLIAAALNQRYGSNFQMQDIQGLREQDSLYELSFPFKSDFKEIKAIIQKMGYDATGYRFVGMATEVRQGDVGFLLDTHVRSDGTPVIALLVAVSADKRFLLYGDGILCPIDKKQFDARFMNGKFLKLK